MARSSELATSWKFELTRGNVSAKSGLAISFTRAEETIDPTGVPCAATTATNQYTRARYDRPFRLAPVTAPELKNSNTSGTHLILGAGVAADGTSHRMIYEEHDAAKLSIMVDDSYANARTTTLTHLYRGPSAKNLFNSRPGCFQPEEYEETNTWLYPVTGFVFHGAIVVAGPAMTPDPLPIEEREPPEVTPDIEHRPAGWCFAINRDDGDPDKWHVLWDDLNDSPEQVNWNRGWLWSLKACPVHDQRTANPTEFWIACADYRSQPGVGGSPNDFPNGGRVYVARMTRPNASSSDWQIDHPDKEFKYFDLPRGTVATDGYQPNVGCHAHAAYILEYGATNDEEPRVQLVAAFGDGQPNSRFARFIWNNTDGNFMNGWTTVPDADNFHGRRATSTAAADRGSRGMQPVGVAGVYGTEFDESTNTTYHKPSLIWGGDVQTEWLTECVLPRPGQTQATFNHLFGWGTGFGSVRTGTFLYPFFLTSTVSESFPNPANPGPWVVVTYDTSQPLTTSMARVLYHPGTGDLANWRQVVAVHGANVASAVPFNGAVWFTQWGSSGVSGAPTPGLYRVAAPTDDTAFEPIVISPGGRNLVHTQYLAEEDTVHTQAHDITAISRNTTTPVLGVFEDGGVALPVCPTMAERAYKIESRREKNGDAGMERLSRVHVSSNSASVWNGLDPGDSLWATGKRIRRMGGWALANSYGASQGFTPNKTIQMSTEPINLDGSSNLPSDPAPTQYSCRDRWCPVTLIGYHEFTADPITSRANAFGVIIKSSASGGIEPDDNNFYFVVDRAMDGFGSLPYPIDHTTSTASQAPDERLTITVASFGGPDLGIDTSDEWSARFSAVTPEADWDQYAERVADNDPEDPPTDRRYWPLFNFWINDTNYFEFQANCVERGFRLKTVLNNVDSYDSFGTGNQLWVSNSQLYIVVSFKTVGGSRKLFVGASLGGGPVATLTKTLSSSVWPTDPISQVRFRAGPKEDLPQCIKPHEVVTARWVGGDIQSGSGAAYDSDGKMQDAFSDPMLTWTKGP